MLSLRDEVPGVSLGEDTAQASIKFRDHQHRRDTGISSAFALTARVSIGVPAVRTHAGNYEYSGRHEHQQAVNCSGYR